MVMERRLTEALMPAGVVGLELKALVLGSGWVQVCILSATLERTGAVSSGRCARLISDSGVDWRIAVRSSADVKCVVDACGMGKVGVVVARCPSYEGGRQR